MANSTTAQAKLVAKLGTSRVAFVKLDQIHWDRRFRTELGDLEGLIESIKEKGVLQPVTVTNELELLAGERRVTAARAAGLEHIPCLIREKGDAIDSREVELYENIFRQDFHWSERDALVQEIDRLYREKNLDWSVRKTAQLLNRSIGSVSRSTQLANACQVIPELKEYKTQDEALKVLKGLEEQAITDELAARQETRKAANDGIGHCLRMADANYHAGTDTFVALAELRSGGMVHIIECDPPYGIDLQSVKASKDNVTSNIHSYNEISKEEYPQFLDRLTKELFRVANANCWLVFWFGPSWQHEVLTSLRAAGWLVDEIPAIWTKPQGQTMQPEIYLGRCYEPFYLARKGQPVLMKRGRNNVFNFQPVTGTAKIHPTERPVALIEEILSTLSVPQQTLLVPFLGSGNTLRAAYNLGMHGWGYDLSLEYKAKFMLRVEEDCRRMMIGTDEVK